jgi:hypothetical protein
MAEQKGVAMAILGIVALIAVVGLVMLFSGATGKSVNPSYGDKLYGGDLTRGPMYEDGFVRYSTNRLTSGPLYGYMYGDEDFRARNQDTGNASAPYGEYDTDYKRTPPILNNPCPFPPYSSPTTLQYAQMDHCIPIGYNPENKEQYDVGVNRYNTQVCCITAVRG